MNGEVEYLQPGRDRERDAAVVRGYDYYPFLDPTIHFLTPQPIPTVAVWFEFTRGKLRVMLAIRRRDFMGPTDLRQKRQYCTELGPGWTLVDSGRGWPLGRDWFDDKVEYIIPGLPTRTSYPYFSKSGEELKEELAEWLKKLKAGQGAG